MLISEHIRDEDLELYLTGHLPSSKESVIEAHLSECMPCAIELSKADEFLCALAGMSAEPETHEQREKRREHRFATNDPAALLVLNPFSAGYLEVRIIDVSKNGLRLQVPGCVRPGCLVKVRLKDSVAFGDIRYCIAAQEGFFVGLRLREYAR